MATETKIGEVYTGKYRGTEFKAIVTADGVLVAGAGEAYDTAFPTLAQASKAIRGYSGGGQFWTLVSNGRIATISSNNFATDRPRTSEGISGTVDGELHEEAINQEAQTMTAAAAEPQAQPTEAEAPKRARTTDPLEAGQKYTAKFKNVEYVAQVVDVDGKPKVKRMDDGSVHSGLSSAGKSITGYAVTAGTFWTKA